MEIERKYLVKGDFTPHVVSSERIVQGYICDDPERTVRVRVRGDKGFITIKGKGSSDGMSRFEWEHEIPVDQALGLMHLCRAGVIDKVRHIVPFAGHEFEVDVFHGENEGLVMAEVELSSTDERVELPEWIGAEVTGDVRYYNAYISTHPYSSWAEEK